MANPDNGSHRLENLKVLLDDQDPSLIADHLPPHHHSVIAHCAEYQCLAYLDELGHWRNQYCGTPLEEAVLAWSDV